MTKPLLTFSCLISIYLDFFSLLILNLSLVCVFLQREPDYPCIDEVTEPNDTRFVIGLAMLLFMVAVLTPFPQA